MKTIKHSFIVMVKLSILLTILSGCEKDHMFDWTKSTGKITIEYRTVGSFNSLHLSDNVDVILHTDTTPFVRVTAGQNIMDGIITETKSNTLYIRNENRYNWVRSFKNRFTVEIGMAQPEKISYYGSGNVSCHDTMRFDGFTFDCWNGSGTIDLNLNTNTSNINIHVGRCDIHLMGNAGNSYLYNNDTGIIDADQLKTANTYLRSSSTGDCKVNVTNELAVEINHTGNVYYSGNPSIINQQISGSGKLIKY